MNSADRQHDLGLGKIHQAIHQAIRHVTGQALTLAGQGIVCGTKAILFGPCELCRDLVSRWGQMRTIVPDRPVIALCIESRKRICLTGCKEWYLQPLNHAACKDRCEIDHDRPGQHRRNDSRINDRSN